MSPFRLQQKTVEHILKVETSCYFDKKNPCKGCPQNFLGHITKNGHYFSVIGN